MWPVWNTVSALSMDKELMEQAFSYTGRGIIKVVEPSGDSLANCVVSSLEIFAALGTGTVPQPACSRISLSLLFWEDPLPALTPQGLSLCPADWERRGGSQLTWRASTTPRTAGLSSQTTVSSVSVTGSLKGWLVGEKQGVFVCPVNHREQAELSALSFPGSQEPPGQPQGAAVFSFGAAGPVFPLRR